MKIKGIGAADTTGSDHPIQEISRVLADGVNSEFDATNVVTAGDTAATVVFETNHPYVTARGAGTSIARYTVSVEPFILPEKQT